MSVLTPTIPGREPFLKECVASVAAQTFRQWEHLILLDEDRRGCAATMNELAGHAFGEWLLILADDDILLPRCLELLLAGAAPPAEIVYAPPLVWGEDSAQFCAAPPNIPAVALVRKTLWERLGGYSLDVPSAEDNALWRLAESRGVTFTRVDQHPTWVYRFHGGNKSRVGLAS